MRSRLRAFALALRSLSRDPAYSLVSVATLALGLIATLGVYSVVDAVLFKALPYPEPQRIVRLFGTQPARQDDRGSTSVPDLFDFRAESRTLEGLSAFLRWHHNLTAQAGKTQRTWGGLVSRQLFETLGVEPLLGRVFNPEEDSPGGPHAVILSYGLWQKYLGADPEVIGRRMTIDGVEHRVVGVMPPGFHYPPDAQLWTPLAMGPTSFPRSVHALRVVARLKPGIPLEQAQAELDGIAARLAARYPESNAGRGAVLVPLPELTVGKARSGLLALLWGAFLVLAIAVGNVANLTLSRYHARYQDLGVRLALGAGRLRLLATAFHETLLLALAASVLALAVAKPLVAFFVRVALEQESSSFLAEAVHELPRLDEVGVGLRAGTAAVLAALGISWLISLAPLCWLSEGRLSRALASGGKGRGGESSAAARLRRAVAIVEVGLAVGLTVLSLSLASSMARLRRVDPGFRTDHVLTLNLFLPVAQYAASGQTSRFYSEMLQRVEALPGVVSAGLTFGLPLSDLTGITDFGLDGPRGAGASKGENRAAIQPVSPRYFETVGVPLLSGRALAVTDAAGSLPVALINQALARRYFPGQNPVGERLFVDAQFGPVGRVPAGWKQIVGVVGDFRRTSLTGEAGPEIYLPYTQLTWRAVSLAIRTSIDPQALAVPVERELAAIDPLLAVSDLRPLADSVERSLAQPRFLALLSLVFAATAVLLALLGVYGIVAYSTQSRLHESGVRVACGAGAGEVVSRFLAEVTMLVLGGSLLGLVVVGAGELWLRGLPWVGSSFEPLSLVGVPLAFLALAWLASYRPIRVALSRNPLDSLR